MKPCLSSVRRCRPLLGTFVEITVNSHSQKHGNDALELAFAAIEHVQRLMSFHDSTSDVSQMNRRAAKRKVKVSAWTYAVLLAAEQLHKTTGGIFDITIASHLQRLGYLPKTNAWSSESVATTNQASIELMPEHHVRFRQSVQIDLGGIAKGFAVDKGVEALQAFGVPSGLVNAGGDLRAFGPEASIIHVRHPGSPAKLLPLAELANAAIATSADYFTRKRVQGRTVVSLIDPIRRQPCRAVASVSVQAPTCLIADALTKVVMVLGGRSAELLRHYSASARIITRAGKVISPEILNEA